MVNKADSDFLDIGYHRIADDPTGILIYQNNSLGTRISVNPREALNSKKVSTFKYFVDPNQGMWGMTAEEMSCCLKLINEIKERALISSQDSATNHIDKNSS